MRKALAISILLSLSIPLWAQGQEVCRIVVPPNPSRQELYAATQLRHFLVQGGLSLPPVENVGTEAPRRGTVYVGRTPQRPTLQPTAKDSYIICGAGGCLFLYGEGEKGTLYAVCDFLERFGGCRYYAAHEVDIPDLRGLRIPDTMILERPAFEYREMLYYMPNHDSLYADWHHLHTRRDLHRDWGMFVHTFKDLIPASRYFERHPEWFSECNGQRVRDGQLCLANPEMREELIRRLADTMRRRPDARIWSVSNNDNYNVCQCPACRRLDSLHGGPTGTLLHFVNQVARQFPDKTISTLAYQYTRSAPKDLKEKPDSNVNIMFCSIECGRELPIADNPREASFRKDMEDWQQLTGNIFMWDYVVQFRNFWNPFPNLHVLKPNLQYFRDHGVRMMFEQATGADNVTSWMELRGYLIAKLMWNPDLDADSLITDFCNGYYGAAGPYVKAIVDTMTAALVASGQRLDIYGYSVDAAEGYLDPDRMRQYNDLMNKAFQSMPDSIHAYRLRSFELALDYATVELAANGGMEEMFPDDTPEERVEHLLNLTDWLVQDLKLFGVKQMMEMGVSPDEYGALIRRSVEKTFGENKAFFRAVQLRKAPTPPYNHDYQFGGGQALTDGWGGILDYRGAWLGFWGDTLDAVVTLGEGPVEVREVSMDFFFYPLSWIFLPQSIEYLVSNDGEHWQSIGRHTPVNREVLAIPAIETFTTTLQQPLEAHYLRVVATPIPAIPAWHRATGQKAWIFTDEILVR